MLRLKAGDKYYFGSYPQTANPSDGKMPIKWHVLAVDDGRALLLSEKILDCKKYNEVLKDVTWEVCTLRAWLNDVFYMTAFSAEEQARIIISTVNNEKSRCDTLCGNNTSDKIFLLSDIEATKPAYNLSSEGDDFLYEYDDDFDDEEKNDDKHNRYYHAIRAAVGTEYAINQGLEIVREESVLGYGFNCEYIQYPLQKVVLEYGPWWLRTNGYVLKTAAYIGHDGLVSLFFMSDKVDSENIGVRPALWVPSEDPSVLL